MSKLTEEAQAASAAWRKSSYSLPQGACVEMAQPAREGVLFRDSKVQDGPVVAVPKAVAATFISAVIDSAF